MATQLTRRNRQTTLDTHTRALPSFKYDFKKSWGRSPSRCLRLIRFAKQ